MTHSATSVVDDVVAIATQSYVHGRCNLGEFEEFIERYLFAEFPIPRELARRVAPEAFRTPSYVYYPGL